MDSVEFGAALRNRTALRTELLRNTFPIDQLALVSGNSPYVGSENRTDEGCVHVCK